MAGIHILIVEDQESWQILLSRTLRSLEKYVTPEVAASYATASKLIQDRAFDLAIVDLALPDLPVSHEVSRPNDFKLIEDLLHSEFNQDCVLIVLTSHATSQRTRMALKKFGVFDFLDKDDFDRKEFLKVVKAALYDGLMKRAHERRARQNVFSVVFSGPALSSVHLKGPRQQLSAQLPNPVPVELERFVQRSDGINDLLSPPHRMGLGSNWRNHARTLGTDLLDYLKDKSPEFREMLAAARHHTGPGQHLSIEFRGPREYLGVPFELLNDTNDYLGLNHLLYRLVHWSGQTATGKISPFHQFLDELQREKRKLRILLIASNYGARMLAVDEEIDSVNELLQLKLGNLGVESEIVLCRAHEASLAYFKELLATKHFHLIHYAGHGRFDDRLAEASGLIFRQGNKPTSMSSDSLNILLKDSPTYLMYLSCCVGARAAQQRGSGDFLGMMDSLTMSDSR